MPSLYTAWARESLLSLNRRLVHEIREGWRPDYEGANSAQSGGPVRVLGDAQI